MRFVCIVYLRVVCFCTSVVTSFQFFVYHCGGNYLYAHNLFFFLIPFMKELFDFKLLSLNVRGIRSATKRKALFTWLNEWRYSKIVYKELRNRIVTPPTAKLKFDAHFVNDTLNWKKSIACYIVLPWIQRLANFSVNS